MLALTSVLVSIGLAITNDMWFWLLGSFIYVKFLNFVGLQIGLHRYFTHRSFKTGKIGHAVLSSLSLLTGQGSPISWATNHIHHHRFSDMESDIHSPNRGWLHTMFIWPIAKYDYFDNQKQVQPSPKHLVKDKLVLFIHKNYFAIWSVVIIVSAIIDWRITLYFLLAPAGWSLLHGNIVTNYLSHVKLPGSYRNFETTDASWNNKFIQAFQWGEGLHNNHHHNMSACNQAMKPGEFDIASWFIYRVFRVSD